MPDYGIAIAGDTGGSIKDRRIDLGFNDGELEFWYDEVDVYILTPVPPEDEINYVLP